MSNIRDDRPGFSLPSVDGVYRLLASIAKNAVQDLKDPDPVKALDALEWIWDDGYFYLVELLGFDLSGPDEIFFKAVLNG